MQTDRQAQHKSASNYKGTLKLSNVCFKQEVQIMKREEKKENL